MARLLTRQREFISEPAAGWARNKKWEAHACIEGWSFHGVLVNPPTLLVFITRLGVF
jgi:hypothetical protein